MRLFTQLIPMAALLLAYATAQNSSDPSGHWEGSIQIPGRELTFEEAEPGSDVLAADADSLRRSYADVLTGDDQPIEGPESGFPEPLSEELGADGHDGGNTSSGTRSPFITVIFGLDAHCRVRPARCGRASDLRLKRQQRLAPRSQTAGSRPRQQR